MKALTIKFAMLILLAFMLCLASQLPLDAQQKTNMAQPNMIDPGDGGGGGGGGGGGTTTSLPATPCSITGGPYVNCPNGALYLEELYRGASGTYLYSIDQNEIQNAVNNLGYTRTGRPGGIVLPYNAASYTVPLLSLQWKLAISVYD